MVRVPVLLSIDNITNAGVLNYLTWVIGSLQATALSSSLLSLTQTQAV